VMWHRLTPALAKRFSVIAMDLRGYGWSSAPASDGGALYAKRAMGEDVVAVMAELGHARFRVVAHDRGARVAYRLALDHPGHVEKLALLDILPTIEVWKNIRSGLTPASHWTFLSRPAPAPETEIGAKPDDYFRPLMGKWEKDPDRQVFDPRAMAHYAAAWNDPSRIHAMCEDYRAGAAIDLAADEADLAAGKAILCPTQILTGTSFMTRAQGETPVEVWRRTFAPQAIGQTIDSGHFLAEENAPATIVALEAFL
jgi:haloacetate dehalogenase